ncbi:hypothetical protein HGRIS_011469 [Hohenbuehelia grisea]|uniref:Fungal N-terminal domain-containing protein n=1 Tax=Hohenbuehelia grisea TaxID=104357 RepID=A0ABR3JV49_9AGAR
MDPVSLTASALAFAGAVKKIAESLGQVSENRRKLTELNDDVLRGLHDIQRLVTRDSSGISPATQAEMMADLDYLRFQLEGVHTLCNADLERSSKGVISRVSSNIKSWTRSKAVEEDIARLHRLIQNAHYRFFEVTLVDIRSTAHRAEQRALLHSAEQREKMQHLETAFINMVVGSDSQNQSAQVWTSANVTQDDWNFLRRQVRRILDAFDPRKFTSDMPTEPPTGHHDQEYPWPDSAWGVSFDILFNRGLTEACHASSLLVVHSDSRENPIQCSAKALLFLSHHLYHLDVDDLSASLYQCAITLYSALQNGFPCRQYQRCLAFALSWGSRLGQPFERLSNSRIALDIYEDLCAESSDTDDLGCLLIALSAHFRNLMMNGFVDESLDIARQLLTLEREYITMVDDWSYFQQLPVVTWSASGEADIVLSSERQPSLPSQLAYNLSWALWHVANSLASLGRYPEARIAGIDAIEGLTAFVQVEPRIAELYGYSLDLWRGDLATWVSVHRSPRCSVYQLASTEARGTARIEDAESTPSSAVVVA